MTAMTELGYTTYGHGDPDTALVTMLEIDPQHDYLVRRQRVTFRVATGELCDHDIDFMSAGLCLTVLEMLGRLPAEVAS